MWQEHDRQDITRYSVHEEFGLQQVSEGGSPASWRS